MFASPKWPRQAALILLYFLLLMLGLSVFAVTGQSLNKSPGNWGAAHEIRTFADCINRWNEDVCCTSGVSDLVFVGVTKTPSRQHFNFGILSKSWFRGKSGCSNSIERRFLTRIKWKGHIAWILNQCLLTRGIADAGRKAGWIA